MLIGADAAGKPPIVQNVATVFRSTGSLRNEMGWRKSEWGTHRAERGVAVSRRVRRSVEVVFLNGNKTPSDLYFYCCEQETCTKKFGSNGLWKHVGMCIPRELFVYCLVFPSQKADTSFFTTNTIFLVRFHFHTNMFMQPSHFYPSRTNNHATHEYQSFVFHARNYVSKQNQVYESKTPRMTALPHWNVCSVLMLNLLCNRDRDGSGC